MAGNDESFTAFNATFSKSISQLCSSQLLANVKIPRFDAYKNVFEFLAEFETATTSLDDEQALPLLSKAFPIGCYRPWYETKLAPVIKAGSTWVTVKKIIIERFSAIADQDRHLRKALNLKYDPDGSQKLMDFIEELGYSYTKANRGEGSSDEILVRFIKAAIPDSLHPILNNYASFKDAKNEEMLKDAAKQYDLIKVTSLSKSSTDDIKKELTAVVKDLVKDLRKEIEATRQNASAGLPTKPEVAKERSVSIRSEDRYQRPRSPFRERSPYRDDRYRPGTPPRDDRSRYRRPPSPARPEARYRDYSPRRQEGYQSNGRERNDGYARRSPSPYRSDQNNYSRYPSARSPDRHAKHSDGRRSPEMSIAFDSKLYFERFKKPPSACSHCGQMHWDRHCPRHLN